MIEQYNKYNFSHDLSVSDVLFIILDIARIVFITSYIGYERNECIIKESKLNSKWIVNEQYY